MRKVDHRAIFKTRINQLAAELGDGSPERLAAELRLPARNIGRYCAGEVLPRLGDAMLIAKRAGVSLDWLNGLSDQRVVPGGSLRPADAPPTDTPSTPRRAKQRDT